MMETKLEAFRALLETEQRARLAADGISQAVLDHDAYRARIKAGRKYANVDFGGSGKYMVVLETGEIYGIKAYGVIHRGHYFDTLDTINDWYWGEYRAFRRQPKAA